jgi:hypothetical protein
MTASRTLPSNTTKSHMQESGNIPSKWNGSGCLVQARRARHQKLLVVCPVQTDYVCQDAWFTNYMQDRYGSRQAAKSHWLPAYRMTVETLATGGKGTHQ